MSSTWLVSGTDCVWFGANNGASRHSSSSGAIEGGASTTFATRLLGPVADTDDSSPDQPHPDNPTLHSWIWLKFSVAEIRQRITAARIRFLWGGGGAVVLSGACDAWDENLAWRTQPPIGEDIIHTAAPVDAGQVDYDVTEYVRWQAEHDGVVSFCLRRDPNGVSIPSSEDPLGRGPKLLLEFGGTGTVGIGREATAAAGRLPMRRAGPARVFGLDGRQWAETPDGRMPAGVLVRMLPSGPVLALQIDRTPDRHAVGLDRHP